MPFNPGGGADASQRTFNKYAEPIVGQSLVVVNKPGAGGTRGWAEFVHTKADGYTLAIETPPFSIIPALATPKQTGYTLDQFTHICIYAVVPDVLLVREDSEFKDLAGFVEFAKANPEKIKAANTGTLGADFMTTLLIENATDVKFTQIPFTGGSQALPGTLSGTTDAMVASALFAVAQKGSLRTLAIASQERDPNLPDVPTFTELGYDVVSERYRALAGPPELPDEMVELLGGCLREGDEGRSLPRGHAEARPAAGLQGTGGSDPADRRHAGRHAGPDRQVRPREVATRPGPSPGPGPAHIGACDTAPTENEEWMRPHALRPSHAS